MNGNIPIGAQYDPNAPWFESEPFETEYDVEVTAVLTCETTVTTEEAYYDEDGNLCDENVYLEDEFYNRKKSPKDLIKYLYNILREHPEIKFSDRDTVLESCGIWLGGREELQADER